MSAVFPHEAFGERGPGSTGTACGRDTDSRSSYKLVRGNGVGYAVPGFSRDCLYRLIDFPELPLRASTRDVVKAGDTTLVVRAELPVAGAMRSVAYKRVERRGWIRRLTDLVRTNRILRAWRLAALLDRRGVATARPLAVVVPRRWRTDRPSYVATEWLDGTSAVDVFCRDACEHPPPKREERLRAAAVSLAQLLGRMHAQRISHRDLKLANLLLRQRGGVEAFVIDLDGASTHFRLTRRRRHRNLARFAVAVAHLPHLSRTLHLRFLKQYLVSLTGRGVDWKAAWRDIAARTAALARRKARRQPACSRIPAP